MTREEYVKKEDALKAICKFCPCGDNGLGLSPCRFPEYCISDELKELNGLQTYSFPNSAENKGEWIAFGRRFNRKYKCDKCGVYVDIKYNFCPNCGADMRGEEDVK